MKEQIRDFMLRAEKILDIDVKASFKKYDEEKSRRIFSISEFEDVYLKIMGDDVNDFILLGYLKNILLVKTLDSFFKATFYELITPTFDDVISGEVTNTLDGYKLIKEAHDFYQVGLKQFYTFVGSEVLPIEDYSSIRDIFHKGVNVGKLTDNGSEINGSEKLVYGQTIPINSDIGVFFNSLLKAPLETDTISINLFGNISEISDVYNHFYIVLRKNADIWVFDDSVDVMNKMQAKLRLGRRGVYRQKDEQMERFRFPYDLIYDSSELKEKYAKSISFGEENLDNTYFIPLNSDEIKDYERAWFKLFGFELVNYIASQDTVSKYISSETYKQLLLEDKSSINAMETTSLGYWGDQHKMILNEILSTIPAEERKELVESLNRPYSEKTLTTLNEMSVITTKDNFAQLIDWEHHNEVAKFIENKVENYYPRHTYTPMINNFIDKNKDVILSKLKTSNMYFEFDEEIESFGGARGQKTVGYFTCNMNTNYYYEFNIGREYDRLGNKLKPCVCCGKYQPKLRGVIHVKHYKLLAYLTDKKPKNLPLFMQAYRSCEFRPYTGNSLLQQTNPLNRIKDSLSEYKTNGFSIGIYMCKRCFDNYVKGTEEIIVKIK